MYRFANLRGESNPSAGIDPGETGEYRKGRTAAILMFFTLTHEFPPASTVPVWGKMIRSLTGRSNRGTFTEQLGNSQVKDQLQIQNLKETEEEFDGFKI